MKHYIKVQFKTSFLKERTVNLFNILHGKNKSNNVNVCKYIYIEKMLGHCKYMDYQATACMSFFSKWKWMWPLRQIFFNTAPFWEGFSLHVDHSNLPCETLTCTTLCWMKYLCNLCFDCGNVIYCRVRSLY